MPVAASPSPSPARAAPVPDAQGQRPPSRAERRARRLQVALAALSGLLFVAAFPGFDQWYLAFIAFVPVMVAVRGVSVKRALFLGGVMGFVSHAIAYHWVVHLLRVFAHAPTPAAVGGWLLLCVAQGLSYGVGVALTHWLWRRTGWPLAATLAVGLTAMDFLYPLLFPSFIANTMGGSLWMMQIADLFGILGVTALVGAINGMFTDALLARREGRPFPRRTAIVASGIWLASLVYGAVRVAQIDAEVAKAEWLTVGIVQANVGGAENLVGRAESRRRYVRATHELTARHVDLVVWPEGALRAEIDADSDLRRDVLGGTGQALLFGATRVGPDSRTDEEVPYNSAFLANTEGRIIGSYDKSVLLAFGEYIPGDRFFPGVYRLLPYSSHFGRGTSLAPLVLTIPGDEPWRLGTFICYEDIIPRFVRDLMVPHHGPRPHVMINITNDSWYGNTTEPAIHLSLAKWRAVEHRRALVRSTNTGISAFVDPAGRLVAQTRTYREETLVHDVPRMTGDTVYEVIGDVVGYLALALLGVGYRLGRRRGVA